MARFVTLVELTAAVRESADIRGMDDKWTDAIIAARVNRSVRMYREMISDRGHEYYLAHEEVTTETPSAWNDLTPDYDFELPSTCHRVYAIDVQHNGGWYPLDEYEMSERHRYQTYAHALGTPLAYRLGGIYDDGEGGTKDPGHLIPRPDKAYTLLVTFLPSLNDVAESMDMYGGEGWESWPILDTAAGICAAEGDQNQYAMLVAERDRVAALIADKRGKRTRGRPQHITGRHSGRGRLWRA